MKSLRLSFEVVDSLFIYDPLSGELRWKVRQKNSFSGAIAGYDQQGYRRVRVGKADYMAHRIIWCLMSGRWPTLEIDHINGVRNDNRFCNLREATKAQNQANRKLSAKSATGYKGVSYMKTNRRYVAYINKDGKRQYLGFFKTAEEAHLVVTEARKNLHGEFARLN